MGKWNKAPPEVSEEFLQNEERRKQMIIEATKRRKQKQRKLQQQVDQQKRQEQQALTKHKQQKKDAYVKYLRNNMHDKYEEMKRNQKQNQPEIRSKSKWRKDGVESESQIKGEKNLQGLDLQVNIQRRHNNFLKGNNSVSNKGNSRVVGNQRETNRNMKKQKAQDIWVKQTQQQKNSTNINKVSQKRRMLQAQFENMWQQQHEEQQKQIDYQLSVQQTVFEQMMGSKLLDSLDLDLDTVVRGKHIDKKLKKQSKNYQLKNNNNNKEIDEIKNMIGYESVLVSIDERSEMIKKYNQFMTNQIPQINNHIKIQQEPIKIKQQTQQNKNNKNIKSTTKSSTSISSNNNAQKNEKPLNQGQVFNELRNKKQGKILNWAKDQAQQAQDLFSNCSTNNKKSKIRASQLLKQINKEIQQKTKKEDTNNIRSHIIPQNNLSSKDINMKKKQKILETIPEKRINSSIQRLRERSYQKGGSSNLPLNSDKKAQLQQQQAQKNSFSRQKVTDSNTNKPRQGRMNAANPSYPNNLSQQVAQIPRQVSRQRVNKTATNSFKQNSNNMAQNNHRNSSRNDSRNRRSLSKQKESTNDNVRSSKDININNTGYSRTISINKTASQILPNNNRTPSIPQNNNTKQQRLPHLPPTFQKPTLNNNETITIATQQQVFEIQSFIKNQLVSLNRQQRQIQQQLRGIHIENKQKIKEIQKKYDIKTDYKHSHQLRNKQDDGQQLIDQKDDNQSVNSYQHMHKKQSQDQLQESIQRLDDMLMRRDIVNKQKQSRITEQDNESETSTHRSLINPMSDPISLHKQVLQLAENLSRFQGQPEDIATGYGAKLRIKQLNNNQQKQSNQNNQIKKQQNNYSNNKNNNNSYSNSNKQRKQTDIDMSESQDVNYSELNQTNSKSKVSKISKVSKPPSLQYQNYNCNIPSGYGESLILDDQLEDSIEKGKIQVNQRLKNMLLD